MDVVKIGKAKPVQSVVDELRQMLRAAEDGEIRHIAMALTVLDGGIVTARFGEGEGDIYKTIGALSRLIHRIHRDADETSSTYNFPDDKKD